MSWRAAELCETVDSHGHCAGRYRSLPSLENLVHLWTSLTMMYRFSKALAPGQVMWTSTVTFWKSVGLFFLAIILPTRSQFCRLAVVFYATNLKSRCVYECCHTFDVIASPVFPIIFHHIVTETAFVNWFFKLRLGDPVFWFSPLSWRVNVFSLDISFQNSW